MEVNSLDSSLILYKMKKEKESSYRSLEMQYGFSVQLRKKQTDTDVCTFLHHSSCVSLVTSDFFPSPNFFSFFSFFTTYLLQRNCIFCNQNVLHFSDTKSRKPKEQMTVSLHYFFSFFLNKVKLFATRSF